MNAISVSLPRTYTGYVNVPYIPSPRAHVYCALYSVLFIEQNELYLIGMRTENGKAGAIMIQLCP